MPDKGLWLARAEHRVETRGEGAEQGARPRPANGARPSPPASLRCGRSRLSVAGSAVRLQPHRIDRWRGHRRSGFGKRRGRGARHFGSKGRQPRWREPLIARPPPTNASIESATPALQFKSYSPCDRLQAIPYQAQSPPTTALGHRVGRLRQPPASRGLPPPLSLGKRLPAECTSQSRPDAATKRANLSAGPHRMQRDDIARPHGVGDRVVHLYGDGCIDNALVDRHARHRREFLMVLPGQPQSRW